MANEKFTFAARLKSFTFALRGLKYAVIHEHNARVHLTVTVLVVAAGLALGVTSSDWRWLIMCIGLVWFAELINSAFEYLCDALHPGSNESIGRAKDIAAAAVMITAIASAIIGISIFWPYLRS